MSTPAERESQRLAGQAGIDVLGSNDADNIASTSAVVGNMDGSLVERTEVLLGGLPASFHPVRGFKVTKNSTIASAPDALFDVTGKCEITLMLGEVTSVIATSTSMSINTSTNDDVIVASTQITTDAVGTQYLVSGDPDLGFNGGGTPTIDSAMQKVGTECSFIVNDDQIEMNVNTAGTGLILWELWYWPLEAGASVAAAA
jgi:hypothetical protein